VGEGSATLSSNREKVADRPPYRGGQSKNRVIRTLAFVRMAMGEKGIDYRGWGGATLNKIREIFAILKLLINRRKLSEVTEVRTWGKGGLPFECTAA